MASVSKLQVRDEDRISALPEAVLFHILSFLPTIDVTQTSLLSRRWNNLWASVDSLDFGDGDHCVPNRFSKYVDSVLFLRNSSDIRKFSFQCCSVEDYSRIDGWIRTAIRRNVSELDLCVESIPAQYFELPQSVFLCKTLKVLVLRSKFIINAPSSGCFPSLKSLRVYIVHPKNNSIEKLFLCCPVLEDLFISGSYGDRAFPNYVSRPQRIPEGDTVLNFKVSAPELKSLEIRWNTYDGYERCSFLFSAPKLEIFELSQNVLTNLFLENAKSLIKANIVLYNHPTREDHCFAIRATALLAGISNVKYLCLEAHYLKGCCFPALDNLSQLELTLHYCYYWELLTELLKRSRNLEHLALRLHDIHCGDSETQWSPPECVPICLLSQLKTIYIKKFRGKFDQVEAAKYLLKNGGVLNKMTIYTWDPLRPKEELYKELSMFQMASSTCQVEFM